MSSLLADMADKYRVTYDSEKERAMIVHMPDRVVKFKQLSNRLYGMDPRCPEEYIVKQDQDPEGRGDVSPLQFMGVTKRWQFVETVSDNLKLLSVRQQNRAKQARRVYQALGSPDPDALKAIIRMNLIRNNKITTKDVLLAERTFGRDVGALKGKSTRTPIRHIK